MAAEGYSLINMRESEDCFGVIKNSLIVDKWPEVDVLPYLGEEETDEDLE
jgi:hypothetical protein